MNCEKWMLYQSGELTAAQRQAFEEHLKTCPSCRANVEVAGALSQALTAPAAPADLVEKVFAKTTRRKSWLSDWRTVLAGGLAVVLVAVCVGVSYLRTPGFSNEELVAYMSQTQGDEYATFLSDLNLFEAEF